MLQGRAGEPRPLPSGKPSSGESLKGRVPFKFACIAFAAPRENKHLEDDDFLDDGSFLLGLDDP